MTQQSERRDIELNLPAPRERADWGYTGIHGTGGDYRSVIVEADGDVLALDTRTGLYSRQHDLTDQEVAEARRLAGLVWAGTHYTAGGHVWPRKTLYRITSSAGVHMGDYWGLTPEDALDAMARDAGYRDAAHAAEVAGPFDGRVEATP